MKSKEENKMNKQEMDILSVIYNKPYMKQRGLAEYSGHSLGIVNKSIKSLIENGYLDNDIQLTDRAKMLFENNRPRNAIILAAGFGMRMVPIKIGRAHV